jgi:AraC family transcriptional regulator, regulatory protein of adaptative response / DNA-3-methyladenine glycosylase II
VNDRVPVAEPFDGAAVLDYLRARAIPGVEDVDDVVYRRAIPTSSGPAVLVVRPEADHLLVAMATGGALPEEAVARVRRLFDAAAQPAAIVGVLGADPALAPLVERRPGLRVPGAYDGFELAVRAVLGQQVTVRGASTLAGRVVTRAGTPMASRHGAVTHAFPRPAALAATDLAGLGMPASRTGTLRALAAAVANGSISLDLPLDEPRGDAEHTGRVKAALLALPGIGRWTAEYVALRALGDRDAFPASDLGLRRAAAALGLPDDERGLRKYSACWRPWRGYAAVHLWRALSTLRYR